MKPGVLPASISTFQDRRAAGGPGASELTRACLGAINDRNPALGAFVEIAASQALEAAPASDARQHTGAMIGALDGVPVAIKDNIAVAGLHAASGLRALKDRIADQDAYCVAALRRQGAVPLGKTLMDEAAFGALGDNPAFGRCHNPVRHGYTPGGSSGGSAAAVAAGLCLAALGTDTLGSVRIPASYCGVVGYVPSAGLIAMEGVQALAPSFDRVGVLARTLADAACIARALAPSLEADTAGNVPIGVLDGFDPSVPRNILAALDYTVQRFARTGRRVIRIDARDFDWSATRKAALLMIEIEAARVFARLLDDEGSALSPSLRAALEFGRRAEAERIARATRQLYEARRSIGAWFDRAPVIVLPATPQTAFAFDGDAPTSQADFAAPSSILGLPAISIPAPAGADSLPIGVQLLAAPGNDALLLTVAATRAGKQ